MKNLSTLIKNSQLKGLIEQYSQAYKQANLKPFTIGIMGKSGAGKSSLINALCQERICKEGAVGGCTRDIQEIQCQLNEMNITLIDFPGIAENEKWSSQYIDLYKSKLDRLDLVFWIIKSDDRALLEDETFYREYLRDNLNSKKCVFILSQADKVEPKREWNNSSYQPSNSQLDIIKEKHYLITQEFYVEPHNVIPVSVDNDNFKTYNFDEIFNLILFKLNIMDSITSIVPLKTSWNVTQLEVDKSMEFLNFSRNKLKDQFKSLLDDLDDLKNLI